MTIAYVGLGSNLGDREALIRAAVEALPGVVAVSRLRETDPVGVTEQPVFLNGAVALETEFRPRASCSNPAGSRAAPRPGAARALGPAHDRPGSPSLGAETIDEAGLTVPHPRLHERRFALEPLAELDPALTVPGRGPVKDLLSELD